MSNPGASNEYSAELARKRHAAERKERENQPRVRSADRMMVTRIVAAEGNGSGPGHTYREVTYYYDDNGVLLARVDPFPKDAT